MLSGFDKMFDFNKDGKLSNFEKGVEIGFLAEMQNRERKRREEAEKKEADLYNDDF